MSDPIIGRRHFIGTTPHSVYEEAQTGRQYVWNDEGNKVFGLYIQYPEDDEDDPDTTPAAVFGSAVLPRTA